MSDIDWKLVIERQSRDLLFVIIELFALAGLDKGVPVTVLTRFVYRRVLNLLRPAEAALRRLIIIAARGIVLKVRLSGPFPKGLAARLKKKEPASDAASDAALDTPARIPVFNLIEPLKHFALPGARKPFQGRPTSFPRISVPGWSTPYFPPEPAPITWDDPINAARLIRRMTALRHALATLPRQARRYVRWRGKMLLEIRKLTARKRGSRLSTLRPGHPPGHRKKQVHLVDRILSDCCHFMDEARKKPDTS